MTDKTKKILKIIGGGILGFIAAVVLFAIVANLTFNRNERRQGMYDDSYGIEATSLGGSMGFGASSPKSSNLMSDSVAISGRSTQSNKVVRQETDKKIIKTANLDLYVRNIDQAVEEIRAGAQSFGGYITNSNVRNNKSAYKTASVTIKVPSKNFEKIINNIKQVATEVERESVNGQDVTEEYIDLEAQIKNLKSEEKAYARIMEQAVTIEETLNVSSRLSNVRGRIERAEGRFNYLSRQVEMSTIQIDLQADADFEVFGLRWRPLTVAKRAFRDMLEGLADYTDTMIMFITMLPVIILWIITITIGLVITFKFLKFAYHLAFRRRE